MIEVEHLSRHYGQTRAVEDVSFSIPRGELVGLLGHNGAGKSTVMKMLTGYLQPDAGRVRLAGCYLDSQRRQCQRQLGYLPENCPLYPEMTVVEYLDYQAAVHGLGSAERPAAVREVIERTWLGDRALAPIASLSRGYRQRVGVAQAIVHRPAIVILDEPGNGLDPGQTLQMRRLLRELAQDATVLLSTHILTEVEAVCDRVLMMRAGQLVLDARIDRLTTPNGLRLTLEIPPARALPLLQGIGGVRAVERGGGDGGLYDYLVQIEAPATVVAPRLARELAAADIAVHALCPRRDDLESLFRQLNSGPVPRRVS